MKVRYISEQALAALKAGWKDFVPLFAEETNQPLIDALAERLNGASVLRETNYVFPDQPLLESKGSADELKNIEAVFDAMKDLPAAVAMDERLWAGIAIDLCWSYIRRRWDIEEMFATQNEAVGTKIAEHVLFMHNPRRSFTRHAISRLWWLGKLTYDETEPDPYRRTRIVTEDLGYVVDLFERNFSNNPNIAWQFVDAVEAAREAVRAEGKVILRGELRTLCKYLNMLGGVYILDAMPNTVIFEKIKTKAIAIARDGRVKAVEDPEEEDGDDEEV